jgi:ABC-type uncharacterized transport system ATPase subunit
MALLELDKVEKHFGGLAAVNGVTMQVDDGEILAIVGLQSDTVDRHKAAKVFLDLIQFEDGHWCY